MYSKTNSKELSFSSCSPFFSFLHYLILNTSYTNNFFHERVCYFYSAPIQGNLHVFWLILTYQTPRLTQIFLHSLLAIYRSGCGHFIILFINHCYCPWTKFHKSEFQQSNHSIHNYVYWVHIPIQFFFMQQLIYLLPTRLQSILFDWVSLRCASRSLTSVSRAVYLSSHCFSLSVAEVIIQPLRRV